jgi:hypothetical protein
VTTATSGRAFANFVKAITSAVAASGVSSQVTVRGAIDVEMDWNPYPDTREWYDGYDSLSKTSRHCGSSSRR